MTTRPQILMCPPDHYGIDYEINPWMSRRRPTDRELALLQWHALRRLLEQAGATIWYLPPIRGLPDLVFTANAALIRGETAVLSQFRHPQRRGETPYHQRWLQAHGFRLRYLPDESCFEGAGDALFCCETLFAGYRIRSDAQADQQIAALLDCRVIPLELVDRRFYHLDTCFCPVTDDTAIYYPDAFDAYGRKVLGELIDHLIPVSKLEALRFACNAVVLGKTVITNTGCPQLHEALRLRGFTVHETPLGEFIKAGGGAKCLTLRLDGEDAAVSTRRRVLIPL